MKTRHKSQQLRRLVLVGYDAWVDLKQCQGSVVIKMSRQCEIEESYSRGACTITGLKNYP